jgi:cyclohexa-1,5-dienecarbonyl-CoA hydratase
MTIRTRIEEGIGTVTLDHPPLNILTRQMLRELHDALIALAADPGVRVLLLAAEGRHFSAGADVGEHLPPEFRELIPEFLATIRNVAEFPAPVIAAVRGRCLGGGFELAQAADILVAGQGASFGQPEIMLGVAPPAACAFLPGLCPPGLAAELVLTGDAIDARRAYEAGIVGHVVEDDHVEEAARALAARMARHSRAALRLTKRALRHGLAAQRSEALRTAGAIYTNELMETKDAVEGLRAFLDKRKPVWVHR